MSCSKDLCMKTSNNKFFGCPPRMDDGRHFTDYRGNCYVNNLIRANNNTFNSYQYRMFLTQNADNMMQMNRTNACQKNCCGPCKKPYDIGTMMPEQGTVDCLSGSCNFKPLEKNGLGIGRTYSSQPLHCPSWPSDPSQVSKSCCTPAENNFSYYPSVPGKKTNRLTVPGAGLAGSGGDPSYYS
jgi:hypothetical protein